MRGEGQVGLLFAGLGYVAFLPDYLGLGLTSRGFHPYVHAASEAWAALDMLRAGDQFCQQLQVAVNAQLFITGYSQGGHGAMALHRAIEKDPSNEFTVTAAAPLSGPYSISGVMRNLILTDTVYYDPAYIPNTALSYQTA
jgi:dienelactone hydrolase